MDDLISRQAAIRETWREPTYSDPLNVMTEMRDRLKALPSATLERDIPMKPMETTDRTWGIKARQAVCPKCDYYLSNVDFIGDGKRVTYCENCGQAIDWEGWDAECSE